MYLSTKEHDKLNIIVTSFEIPFRTYIAKRIKQTYPDLASFTAGVNAVTIPAGVSNTICSEFGKIRHNPSKYYNLFEDTIKASVDKIVQSEIDVPYVGILIAIVEVYINEFKSLSDTFISYNVFVSQLEKYHYVRNKLDHRGTKTLSVEDMTPVLSFISDVSTFIFIQDETCFWDKDEETLYKEIKALESIRVEIPIEINNFSSVPFSEVGIVCRDQEIEEIKRFVYGTPGALKKKTSLCLFGYGGVGKTAIVTETIKKIVQDVMDETTINAYKPDFILFYSAKSERVDYSTTSGSIIAQSIDSDFSSFEELKCRIFAFLGIDSFVGYDKKGIIVVDNLESLSPEEREKIKDLIDNMSPPNVQYIITSRNEENYEDRKLISGFSGENGIQFINDYIQENSLDLILNTEEKGCLLDISQGNTLVLVLCLIRLSRHLITLNGLSFELERSSLDRLSAELKGLPQNGYEIISEFMFKNTFIELENSFRDFKDDFYSLLGIFAVYPDDEIDIYTICILIKKNYYEIQPLIMDLCKYLILEKTDEKYILNPFAKKYIIQRLLPDKTTYNEISNRIERSMSEIKRDQKTMETAMASNPDIRKIINDWFIIQDGDKIAAAKLFQCYQDVKCDCRKTSEWWHKTAYDAASKTIEECQRATIHPYIKFQSARIFHEFYEIGYESEKMKKSIKEAYSECLWLIKSNSFYSQIKSTKTFASVLWLYGTFLYNIKDYLGSICQMEEAIISFETINNKDTEYYKCLSQLGWAYYSHYCETNEIPFLNKASDIVQLMIKESRKYHESVIVRSVKSLERNVQGAVH